MSGQLVIQAYGSQTARIGGTAPYRTAIAANDSATVDELAGPLNPKATLNRTNIGISARFNLVTGEADLFVLLWLRKPDSRNGGTWHFLGTAAVINVSADAADMLEATNFTPETVLADIGGATHYEVRVGALANGPINELFTWTF